MQDDLGRQKYEELLKILNKYIDDGNYALYRDSLFEIFREKRWYYNLKGMISLTKPEHRAAFNIDVVHFEVTFKNKTKWKPI